MPWIRDRELHPEWEQRYQEPARVMLMLCGPKIFINAERKDTQIEIWLSWIKMGVAG